MSSHKKLLAALAVLSLCAGDLIAVTSSSDSQGKQSKGTTKATKKVSQKTKGKKYKRIRRRGHFKHKPGKFSHKKAMSAKKTSHKPVAGKKEVGSKSVGRRSSTPVVSAKSQKQIKPVQSTLKPASKSAHS